MLKDELNILKENLTENKTTSVELRQEISRLRNQQRQLDDEKLNVEVYLKSLERDMEGNKTSAQLLQEEKIYLR